MNPRNSFTASAQPFSKKLRMITALILLEGALNGTRRKRSARVGSFGHTRWITVSVA